MWGMDTQRWSWWERNKMSEREEKFEKMLQAVQQEYGMVPEK